LLQGVSVETLRKPASDTDALQDIGPPNLRAGLLAVLPVNAFILVHYNDGEEGVLRSQPTSISDNAETLKI
jgi:hypothetical protein